MLYHDKIDISEGIYLTKSNKINEWMICHYWFFNHGFKFQDLSMQRLSFLTILGVNISDVAIITIIIITMLVIVAKWWIYIKSIVLIFSLFKAFFFFFTFFV